MTLTDEIDHVHVRKRLPNRRAATSFDFEQNGIRFVATYSHFADGSVGEIFISNHKAGIGILEKVSDEFNATSWQPQMEGARTGRELPGIVDQIITMQWIDFGDGAPTRAFVCTSPNAWGYPAKDRAGRLEQIEEPHLGKLIVKLVGPGQRKPFIVSPEQTLKAAK
jgi:hypothetical protein